MDLGVIATKSSRTGGSTSDAVKCHTQETPFIGYYLLSNFTGLKLWNQKYEYVSVQKNVLPYIYSYNSIYYFYKNFTNSSSKKITWQSTISYCTNKY